MPTGTQITAAKLLLDPQPYSAVNSALTTDGQAQLLTHLRKFLYDTGRSGAYKQIAVNLAAARGIKAAQLQAVLTNLDKVGSKVAALTGTVTYSTETTKNSELEYALLVMYEPVPVAIFATTSGEFADAIRGLFCCNCGFQRCRCSGEFLRTVSRVC